MGHQKIRERLLEGMAAFQIVDTHEHLLSERARLDLDPDVFGLFSQYAAGDLSLAGMPDDPKQRLFAPETAQDDKWKLFEPYWGLIKRTCYSRAVLLSIKKFYGFDDVTASNYKEITDAIREANTPGIYRRILRDACNIKVALTQPNRVDVDPDPDDPILQVLMPLAFINGEVELEDITNPHWRADYVDLPIASFDDLIAKVHAYIRRIKAAGALGAKVRVPYSDYPFEGPDRSKAKELFNDIKAGRIKKAHRHNPLHYYCVDQAIEAAAREDLVVAVHTGYWGDFRDYSPLHLIPFLQRHPDAKFDVYHLGYPWLRESLMLAKGFANVWCNFCWLHIISQRAARDACDEAIELLPKNKIFAFGGDYLSGGLENIYGHLVMARENIADVFARRIADGWIDFDEAMAMIKGYFCDNPARLYALE